MRSHKNMARRRALRSRQNFAGIRCPMRVVALGGGTGLSTLLSGLKPYVRYLTAIVSVADNGGSSGRLREQLGILPPGDIRQCLTALADDSVLRQLFGYRFSGPTQEYSLQGHAMGNLILAAIEDLYQGDFMQAIQEASRLLHVSGQVLPCTLSPVHLQAETMEGMIVNGESRIGCLSSRIKRLKLLPDNAAPAPGVIEAIESADIIVLGPGSLFTSIIPNLLIDGIREAIKRSHARRMYVCNLWTQGGETTGFTASEHLAAMEEHVGLRIIDEVIINVGSFFSAKTNKSFEEMDLVVPDLARIHAMGYQVIQGDLMDRTNPNHHDRDRLARVILQLPYPQENRPVLSQHVLS